MIQFNASRSIRFDSEQISMENPRIFPQSECIIKTPSRAATICRVITSFWARRTSKKKRRKFIHGVYYPLPFSALIVLRTFKILRRYQAACFFSCWGCALWFRCLFLFLTKEKVIKKAWKWVKDTPDFSANSSGFSQDLETESFSADENRKSLKK
jgi:hypothetical protein